MNNKEKSAKEPEVCPWGCIFEIRDGKPRLEGDCRMPESDDCYFNKIKAEKNGGT